MYTTYSCRDDVDTTTTASVVSTNNNPNNSSSSSSSNANFVSREEFELLKQELLNMRKALTLGTGNEKSKGL